MASFVYSRHVLTVFERTEFLPQVVHCCAEQAGSCRRCVMRLLVSATFSEKQVAARYSKSDCKCWVFNMCVLSLPFQSSFPFLLALISFALRCFALFSFSVDTEAQRQRALTCTFRPAGLCSLNANTVSRP